MLARLQTIRLWWCSLHKNRFHCRPTVYDGRGLEIKPTSFLSYDRTARNSRVLQFMVKADKAWNPKLLCQLTLS